MLLLRLIALNLECGAFEMTQVTHWGHHFQMYIVVLKLSYFDSNFTGSDSDGHQYQGWLPCLICTCTGQQHWPCGFGVKTSKFTSELWNACGPGRVVVGCLHIKMSYQYSIGIPFIEIRRSHDRHIIILGIHIPRKGGLKMATGSWHCSLLCRRRE